MLNISISFLLKIPLFRPFLCQNIDLWSQDDQDDQEAAVRSKKEKSSSGHSDQGEAAEAGDKKKKGKKYDYATKLNYLFRWEDNDSDSDNQLTLQRCEVLPG